MATNNVKKNQSVGKLLDIIEIMIEFGSPIRLNELSQNLNMSPTTVYRFLVTLMDRDYVRQDPDTSRYYLTLRLKYYADKIESNYNLNQIVHPYLRRLSADSGESVSLVVKSDNMAVYIDKVAGTDRIVSGLQRIGKRAPLYCTGVGKVFLADMSYEERLEVYNSQPMERFTQHTITDVDELNKEVDHVVRDDIAYDNEECEIGARCIAAPIRDYTGEVVAAISISGPTPRMNEKIMGNLLSLIKDCSDEISKELGYIK